jgi:hypothetical protein
MAQPVSPAPSDPHPAESNTVQPGMASRITSEVIGALPWLLQTIV